jgi:hypothetical protein
MSNKSGFLKSGLLALALAGVLPVAAQAAQFSNDTGYQSQASQGRASNPVSQTGTQAPAQLQN